MKINLWYSSAVTIFDEDIFELHLHLQAYNHTYDFFAVYRGFSIVIASENKQHIT